MCLLLDVTQVETIRAAFERAIEKFESIHVVVNNAGYAPIGAFEACEMADIDRQFATLNGCDSRHFTPFPATAAGVFVNVSSIGRCMTFPFYSPYHGTKWAVEGFSESFQYERGFNIRVKIIEPGAIKTDV